jgi:hypothetical protein
MRSTQENMGAPVGSLPLTLPRELWTTLSPAQRAVYRRAESLLDQFTVSRRVTLAQILSQGPRAEVLRALQVLGGMSLIEVDSGDDEPWVTLLALPDEHVRFTGPDGKTRWIFVARPIDPKQVDSTQLN